MPLIGRLGDFSDHQYNGSNGYIISVSSAKSQIEGKVIAAIGDLHFCPVPGHGITRIVNGSGAVKSDGGLVATMGSVCGCGAKLIAGSQYSNAPFGDLVVGAGKLSNTDIVLGPPGAGQAPLILG